MPTTRRAKAPPPVHMSCKATRFAHSDAAPPLLSSPVFIRCLQKIRLIQDLLERTLQRDHLARPSFRELVKEVERLISLEQQGWDLHDCSLDFRPPSSRTPMRWQQELTRKSYQEVSSQLIATIKFIKLSILPENAGLPVPVSHRMNEACCIKFGTAGNKAGS